MKREADQLGMTVAELERDLRAERPRVDVVLMAYGSQERLGGVIAHPKQLLHLPGGETILERTLGLLGELALSKVAICAPPEIAEAAMAYRPNVMVRNGGGGVDAENATLVGNMYASSFKPSLDHEQLFLLADVVWSRSDLERVLKDHHPAPLFFGRHENLFTAKPYGELFGVRATPRGLAPFVDCRTLWAMQSRIGVHAPVREIHGYTDDVDTPEDFAERLPLLRRFVENEVSPCPV